jgi:hypothetical protein
VPLFVPRFVSPGALVLAVGLGALHSPSCGSDAPGSGPNAPCERSSDCEDDLSCLQGVCVSPDAGAPLGPHLVDSGAADGPHDGD